MKIGVMSTMTKLRQCAARCCDKNMYSDTQHTCFICLLLQYAVLHKMVKQRLKSTKNLMYLHFIRGQIISLT